MRFATALRTITNFNPRTPCGVRPRRRACAHTCANFNPRTPCGVRRTYIAPSLLLEISIHAPLAGCDGAFIKNHALIDKFQSTHPLRGATPTGYSCCICLSYFNPRTPCGVRLTGPALPSRALLFQSTHPLRGATPPRSPGSAAMSNFNPRTPCGVRPMRRGDRQEKQGDFNPRTPCGVRPRC